MLSSCSPVTCGAAFTSSAIINFVVDVFVVYGATETKADAEYDAMAKMTNSSD